MGSLDPSTLAPVAVTLAPGDALVLASDGIEVVDESAMMELMSAPPSPGVLDGAAGYARRLVEAALARHTTDNVTVAVVRQPPR